MTLVIGMPGSPVVGLLARVAALRRVRGVVLGRIHDTGWRSRCVGRRSAWVVLLDLRAVGDAMSSLCYRSWTVTDLGSVVTS